MALVKDQSIASIIGGEILFRSLKLSTDDLWHCYHLVAMAKPGIASNVESGDRLLGKTLAGWLFIKNRDVMLNSAHKEMKVADQTNHKPNAMLRNGLRVKWEFIKQEWVIL